jgi:hypothetical protein
VLGRGRERAVAAQGQQQRTRRERMAYGFHDAILTIAPHRSLSSASLRVVKFTTYLEKV